MLTSFPSFTDAPAFYEPGAPRLNIPILLAQTELHAARAHVNLFAQEELSSIPCVQYPRVLHSRPSLLPKLALKSALNHPPTRRRSSTPQPKRCHFSPLSSSPSSQCPREALSAHPSEHSSDEDDLGLDPDLIDKDDETEGSDLIPKPSGEAGRPGRGGYALKEVLGWDERQYQAFVKFVTKLVNEHLDKSKCYSSQSLQELTLARKLAIDRFPVLQNYAEAWPIIDALRLKLKYMSSRSRQQDLQAAAQIGKQMMRHSTK
ncbi:hypothetical protein NLJ89_g7926 [Agrocybe chaxingu]|uniref:Uncharacterized protein n=1 Tax=Agrocybe chaxingu TaxID=84603 RepID=A0A9W8K3F7_9AGAR|nr:hypothetical protein NLJ89_g7926 [Agrocybe chaxingu]